MPVKKKKVHKLRGKSEEEIMSEISDFSVGTPNIDASLKAHEKELMNKIMKVGRITAWKCSQYPSIKEKYETGREFMYNSMMVFIKDKDPQEVEVKTEIIGTVLLFYYERLQLSNKQFPSWDVILKEFQEFYDIINVE